MESVSKQLHFLKANLFSIYLTILFLNINVFKFLKAGYCYMNTQLRVAAEIAHPNQVQRNMHHTLYFAS